MFVHKAENLTLTIFKKKKSILTQFAVIPLASPHGFVHVVLSLGWAPCLKSRDATPGKMKTINAGSSVLEQKG